MAFSTGSSSGRGRRRLSTLSEINVVPLVDVVLVLLIIFMLTAQVMEFGLEIEVPKVKQRDTSAQEHPVLAVTLERQAPRNHADDRGGHAARVVRRQRRHERECVSSRRPHRLAANRGR